MPVYTHTLNVSLINWLAQLRDYSIILFCPSCPAQMEVLLTCS